MVNISQLSVKDALLSMQLCALNQIHRYFTYLRRCTISARPLADAAGMVSEPMPRGSAAQSAIPAPQKSTLNYHQRIFGKIRIYRTVLFLISTMHLALDAFFVAMLDQGYGNDSSFKNITPT